MNTIEKNDRPDISKPTSEIKKTEWMKPELIALNEASVDGKSFINTETSSFGPS